MVLVWNLISEVFLDSNSYSNMMLYNYYCASLQFCVSAP